MREAILTPKPFSRTNVASSPSSSESAFAPRKGVAGSNYQRRQSAERTCGTSGENVWYERNRVLTVFPMIRIGLARVLLKGPS